MKISPSIIESIAVDRCISVGCILLIYFWVAFKQGPLDPWISQIASDLDLCIKFTKVFSSMATYFDLVPSKGFV